MNQEQIWVDNNFLNQTWNQIVFHLSILYDKLLRSQMQSVYFKKQNKLPGQIIGDKMKLIQYISTSYVREELYNPDNCDLINPKSPPEFISSGGPFCHTCLSLPKFFVQEQNQSHQFLPYPLKFHQKRKATSDYPRCNCTTKPECFGATASE